MSAVFGSPHSIPQAAIALSIAAFTTLLPAQDSLQLKDGRFVIDKKIAKHEEGAIIHFTHGDIIVPQKLIQACTAFEVKVTESSYSEEDKAKMAKGLVLFEDDWISEKKRDSIMAERRKTREQRIKDAKEHRLWRNRYKLETKNFAFEYTIDPQVMKKYADMLEVYYKTFTKAWGIKKPRGMGRLKVCFYHDQDYYEQVSGASPGAIGYFRFIEPIELNFFYDRLDKDLTIDVMFHETNHFLTHLIDPKFHYPSWINESLAEYYGASEWDPKAKKMIIGNLQEGRLATIQDAIRNDEWQGLEDLIRLPQNQFTAIHYAWGWSFVHYLKCEPEEQIRVFTKFMKVDSVEEFEKGWHAHVKGMKAATGNGFRNAGDIALARGMPIKAQRFYRTALDMGDTNCMTHFGYGRALSQKGKRAEAHEQFKKALALQGRFWMYLSDTLPSGDKHKDERERMRQLALEIEPDNYGLMSRMMTNTIIKGN